LGLTNIIKKEPEPLKNQTWLSKKFSTRAIFETLVIFMKIKMFLFDY